MTTPTPCGSVDHPRTQEEAIVEYLRITGPRAEPSLGIVEVYLEVGPDRMVTREIGLDAASQVIHRMPSMNHRFGARGFWDVLAVPEGEFTPVTAELWEGLCAQPDAEVPPLMMPRPSLMERARHRIRGG